jgi:hypothetical protein
MPAAMTIKQDDFQALIRELKKVDADLYNEFRKEFRSEMKPLADKLANNIPKQSPLSGFAGKNGAEMPYLWRKVNPSITVGSRSRGRNRATREVVSINFKQAAFSILELAGVANKGKTKAGMTHRGLNLVRGLEKVGYPLGDRGRWVIPQYYKEQGAVRDKAIKILQKYGDKVSRKLGARS